FFLAGLLGGRGDRLPQTLHFLGQAVAVHKTLRNTERLGIEYQRRANGNACGNRYATFDFHHATRSGLRSCPYPCSGIAVCGGWSPGAASSSASTSTASCASVPLTSRVSSVPCSAASSMSSRG